MSMKRFLKCTVIAVVFVAAFLVFAVHAAPTPMTIYPPTGSGGPIVIAVLADHFTAIEEDDFKAAANNFITYSLMSDPYYLLHASAFSVKAIFEPWTASPSTPSSNYGFELGAGVSNCSIHWAVNTTTLIDNVVRAPLNPAVTVVIGNYDYNFGCKQDTWTYIAVGSLGNRILEHELAHAIGGLYDEFSLPENINTRHPETRDHGNCSTLPTPQWMPLAGASNDPECDLYGVGVVHPFPTCRMRAVSAKFCEVCYYEMKSAIEEFTNPPAAPTSLPISSAGFFGGQPPPQPNSQPAQPRIPVTAQNRSVSVLVRVDRDTRQTAVLSATDISGPVVQHHRRLGDYVYEINEGGNTIASGVIAGNPFDSHSFGGTSIPHTSPKNESAAITVTIPGITRAMLRSGSRAVDIFFYQFGPSIGKDPITPQRLAELKADGTKLKRIGEVPYAALKVAAAGNP
jgi:IgA Peptidase M64